jgi:hypothetical protein
LVGMTRDLGARMIQILPRQTSLTILAHMAKLLETVLIEVSKTTQVSGTSEIQVSKMNQVSEATAIQISKTTPSFRNHHFPDFQNQHDTRS